MLSHAVALAVTACSTSRAPSAARVATSWLTPLADQVAAEAAAASCSSAPGGSLSAVAARRPYSDGVSHDRRPVPAAAGASDASSHAPGARRAAAGSGLERDPSVAVDVDLGPRVGVPARHVVLAVAREHTRGEADGDARRQAHGARHRRVRARELLAVAAAADEQEALH